MKRISAVFGMLLLLVGWAGGAGAISMAELLKGGSITAGDKLFDQWEVYFYDASDRRVLDPGNIDVTAFTDGGMDPGPGLGFEVVNNEFDVTGDGLYAYVDLMFGFRVSVLDPMPRIKDNSLEVTNGFLAWAQDDAYDLGHCCPRTNNVILATA